MAKRIATQLAEEIRNHVDVPHDEITSLIISSRTLVRWLKWAKSIDAQMRLDGSEKNRQRVKR